MDDKFRGLTIKRPDRDDVVELLPALLVVAIWLATAHRGERSRLLILPTLVGLAAWVMLKGLRYVPR